MSEKKFGNLVKLIFTSFFYNYLGNYIYKNLPSFLKTTGLDNDYERVIQVKVPKVPVNYEGRQQSNKHLPTLPEDSSSDAGPDSQIDNIMVGHQDHVVIPTKRPSVSLQVLANFTQYCPPARSRNLFWNWTLAVSRLFFLLLFYFLVIYSGDLHNI